MFKVILTLQDVHPFEGVYLGMRESSPERPQLRNNGSPGAKASFMSSQGQVEFLIYIEHISNAQDNISDSRCLSLLLTTEAVYHSLINLTGSINTNYSFSFDHPLLPDPITISPPITPSAPHPHTITITTKPSPAMHLPLSPVILLLQLSITPSLINAAPLPQASGIAPLPDGTTAPPAPAPANSTAGGTPDAAQGTPDAASQGLDPATLAKLKPVINGLINGIIKADGGSTKSPPSTGGQPSPGSQPPPGDLLPPGGQPPYPPPTTGSQPPRVNLPNPNVPLSPSNGRPSTSPPPGPSSGAPRIGSTGTGKTGPNNPVAGPTIAGPVSNKYPLSTSSNKYPLSTSNYTPPDSTGNGVGGGAGNDVPTGNLG